MLRTFFVEFFIHGNVTEQKTHDESSVEVLYQVGVQNTKENALMDLIVQLLEAPAFHQLRTVEQLGNAEVEALRSITKDDVLKFFDLKFTVDAPQRRKIAVFVYGKDDNGGKIEKEAKGDSKEKLEEIACMEQFRHSLPLYGLPRPKLNLLPVGADPLSEIA
ncbi:hypothetical protein GCK32_011693 [Trichostrongylus colubriformis]|uniref:Uncharacterized protein n=1 Tax=Trichostrongylus colubriformis TaxID=6319 RepID=A0AAN8EYJ2_TRICO